MYLIGLTGGIASGKSVVAGRLSELGAVNIDADRLAREVVEPGTPGLEAIVTEFGPAVLTDDGVLDRAALGSVVFGDPERRAALEAIIHPAVRILAKQRMAEATAADPDAVVVYDVPLLVETGSVHSYDLVVVVEAPAEERIRRLTELRGMKRSEAEGRIAAQATDAERRAVADVVIDSGGTLAGTLRQVDELWKVLPRSTDS